MKEKKTESLIQDKFGHVYLFFFYKYALKSPIMINKPSCVPGSSLEQRNEYLNEMSKKKLIY